MHESEDLCLQVSIVRQSVAAILTGKLMRRAGNHSIPTSLEASGSVIYKPELLPTSCCLAKERAAPQERKCRPIQEAFSGYAKHMDSHRGKLTGEGRVPDHPSVRPTGPQSEEGSLAEPTDVV